MIGQKKDGDNQITVLLPNEPVVIVRESPCKEWYYLYARNAAGWVRKDCIADCGGSDCDIQQRNGRQPDFLCDYGKPLEDRV